MHNLGFRKYTKIAKYTTLTALTGVSALLAGCNNPVITGSNALSDLGGTAPSQFQQVSAGLLSGAIRGNSDCTALASAGPFGGQDVFGNGPTNIAFLLPLSSPGPTGRLARDLRNAAELAVKENVARKVTVFVKDTCGSPAVAAKVAQQAIAQGARVLIGPLQPESVASVAQLAQRASVPVLGFSADAGVAGASVYLMSLLPQNSIDQVVRYAHGQNLRRYAAVLPQSRYGQLAARQMQTTLDNLGGTIETVVQYGASRQAMQRAAVQAARQIQAGGGVDAILVPDATEKAAAVVEALCYAGIDTKKVRVLGSGQWSNSAALKSDALDGAWYPGLSSGGYEAFAGRYLQAFGAEPLRRAGFAYDATLLAAAITDNGRLVPNYREVLTSGQGFRGVDGIFRLRPNGANERGMAIYRAAKTGATIISDAPADFSGSQIGSNAQTALTIE